MDEEAIHPLSEFADLFGLDSTVGSIEDIDEERRHGLCCPLVGGSSFVALPLVYLLLKGINLAGEAWKVILVDCEVAIQVVYLSLYRRDFVTDDLDLLLVKLFNLVVNISLFKTEIRELLVECSEVACELRTPIIPTGSFRMASERLSSVVELTEIVGAFLLVPVSLGDRFRLRGRAGRFAHLRWR